MRLLVAHCFGSNPGVGNRRTCINTRDIESASSKDGKTMPFRLRDRRWLIRNLSGCDSMASLGYCAAEIGKYARAAIFAGPAVGRNVPGGQVQFDVAAGKQMKRPNW